MKEKEYFTVGEIAKEMEVSVRTLQYYHKQGLFKPSAISEGGRRLYTKKDMIKLHQIISLKYLGFSLEEIKYKLLPIDTPQEVCTVLEQQKVIIQNQMKVLQDSLNAIGALYQEVKLIQRVDFGKYADIISLLRQQNRNYWVLKNFDDHLSNHVRERFASQPDKGKSLYEQYLFILDEAVILHQQGESPTSENSINLGEKWWNLVNDFTGGDMSLLPELMKFNENREGWDQGIAKKQELVNDYIGEAMSTYFKTQGAEFPFEEEKQVL